MKPLLSVKVKRGNGDNPDATLNEWQSASDQAADSQPFRARQLARIEAAQKTRIEQTEKVRQLKKGKA